MEKRIGLYIHLPFCAGKCAYCDFNSRPDCYELIPDYQQALLEHIAEMAPQLKGRYVDTVYFGGGTPTHYGGERLVELFDALKSHFSVLIDSEVTVEANPESVSLPLMTGLRKAGFNRMSLGVQSASEAMLRMLGRRHTFKQAADAVEAARSAGFKNISCDLMYGLPSQSKEDWAQSLKRVMALKPEHISAYGLKLEEGTPLYSFHDTPFIPDEDTQADMYLYAVEQLRQYGYRQYEISNFAQPGYESRHNLKYWRCEEYVGFGAGAHSYLGDLRYGCVSDIRKYIQAVQNGGAFIDQAEHVDRFGKASEYLMLGLRTRQGVSMQEYRERFQSGTQLLTLYLDKCVQHHWARLQDGWYSLTPEGFLISNTLIGDLLELQQREQAAMNRFLTPEAQQPGEQVSLFRRADDSSPLFPGI